MCLGCRIEESKGRKVVAQEGHSMVVVGERLVVGAYDMGGRLISGGEQLWLVCWVFWLSVGCC